MKARKVPGLEPDGTLAANTGRIIAVRLAELRDLAAPAMEADAATAQHDLRIAAKRLRYVLEATGPAVGEDGRRGAKAAKALQGVLGDLHDCDVTLPRIGRHAAALIDADAEAVRRQAKAEPEAARTLAPRARHRTAYRGLAVLAVHVQARRALLFDRFVALWDEQRDDGVWEALERRAAELATS